MKIPGKDELRESALNSGLSPVKTRVECDELHSQYHWRNRPQALNFLCFVCNRTRSVNSK